MATSKAKVVENCIASMPLQAQEKVTGIRIVLQITSYKRLQSEYTFDKCRNTDLGGLPESSLAVSAMGLDVKLLLLPVARMLTLVGSGSCSPAWLISLCDGEASAEGGDVVPIWYVGAGARSKRKGELEGGVMGRGLFI